MIRVVFTPEAKDDIAESYEWYERREPGLGEEFLRSIDACAGRIARHPLMYPIAIAFSGDLLCGASHSKSSMSPTLSKS